MSNQTFSTFLDGHDDRAWADAVSALLPSIHEVDRAATRIWFGFHPLVVARALARAKDPERLARRLQIQGEYRLASQIDTSHAFMYGHRYWPQAKAAVVALAESSGSGSLEGRIREAAATAAAASKVDASIVLGIVAAGVMTLQQVGAEAFDATPGRVSLDARTAGLSPADVLAARNRAPKAGLFGFLRTIDHRFTVTFDETRRDATFQALNGQDLAMAGASDTRDYVSEDPRKVEGPIPVECRTAACGTCWVGVLGGADRLSDVDDREWRKMKEFGYLDSEEPKPVLRLACRAKAHGNVTIVVPPWNGVFGKLVDGTLEIDEEPTPTEA